MLFNYIRQLNWIDVFVVILLIRICYVATKNGLAVELFKLFGTLCAIYLSCHYYIKLAEFLNHKLSWTGNLLDLLNLLAFVFLAILGYFLFVIIRRVLTIIIKVEAISRLSRWGALILGVLRWGLFISLLFYAINVSNINYFKSSLASSYSMSKFFHITPRVYAFLWDKIMHHFMAGEKANSNVLNYGRTLSK